MTSTPARAPAEDVALLSTGVVALDDVVGGGLVRNRLYVVEGLPGTGKTTLALQFALEGARRGEPVLYVTLSETAEELHAVAASHGWTLDGVTVHELVPAEDDLDPEQQYTVFHPAEVELSATIARIQEEVLRLRPVRAIIDSLSEVRLLAGTSLRFRRQVLALKQFFSSRDCTLLLLDDRTTEDHDLQVRSIAHAVLSMEHGPSEYGVDRRTLRVVKFRGRQFRGGTHDYSIRRGGLRVFPRLVAAEHRGTFSGLKVGSGIRQFDDLLGGGIEQGTSTLVVGAPGTGKSTLASHFVATAAAAGHNAAMFLFDESIGTLLTRTSGLGIPLREHVESGHVHLQPVDPAEFTPGELVQAIREQVEQRQASIIVLDSLNGYLNAMPGERHLSVHLHELLMYLGQREVATLLIGAHQGLIGPTMRSAVDASYLADAIVLLRYFEHDGELKQAISVVKKRGGAHERTIRELKLGQGGVHVGEPLRGFRGVLSGVPVGGGQESTSSLRPPPSS